MVFLAREFPWEGKEIYQTPLPTMSQQECLLKATFLHHLEKSKFKNLFLTIIIFNKHGQNLQMSFSSKK